MALTCWKIGVCWDALSCDETIDFTGFAPEVTLNVFAGDVHRTVNVQDPDTGHELLPVFNVDFDPTTGCLCTSELPANIGTDPSTHLNPAGTIYELSIKIDPDAKCAKARTWRFQLDADTDYTPVLDAQGCVPINEVSFDTPAALDTDLLDERVCVLPCVTDIQTQIDNLTLGGGAVTNAALDHDAVTGVLTLTDSDGNTVDTTIIATGGDGDTTNATLGHDPATGTLTLTDSAGDTVDTVLPDNDTTITTVAFDAATNELTVTDSAGDNHTATITFPAGTVDTDTTITDFDFDPATNQLTITDSAGTDHTTIIVFPAGTTDTNTTNASLTHNGNTGRITLTDSAGDTVSTVLPDNDTTNTTLEFDATSNELTLTDSEGNTVDATIVFPAGVTDTWFFPILLQAGDTSIEDLTLPDGSTLTAGDPIPADTIVHLVVNETGVLVSQASFEIPSPTPTATRRDSVSDGATHDASVTTSSTAVTPLAINAGTINQIWVSADGAALTTDVTIDVTVDGTTIGSIVVPAGTLLAATPVAGVVGAAVAAGSVASFTVAGDGAGTVTNVVVTFDWTE